MDWWKNLEGKVRFNEPLKNKTTFKIGGPAKFFIQPYGITDLKFLLSSARRIKLPVFIIGAGSNILIGDKGVEAIVLQLNSPSFKRISQKGNFLEVGSGLWLSQLIRNAKGQGLSGIEFLAGIPGTVGGALAMNAGAQGLSIGDFVEKARVMDYNGDIKILNKGEIKFKYRKSSLAKYIILSVSIKLAKKDKKEIEGNMKKYLNYRRATQDTSLPSAGCVFKNPDLTSAGSLIDLCGLKGKKIGRAAISLRHANFIVNIGNARARDVLKLMSLVRKEVRKKFNIDLEPEIKIWK